MKPMSLRIVLVCFFFSFLSFFFLLQLLMLFLAILSKEKLQCLGTTMFLKKMFGIHYYLNIEKSEKCETGHVMNAIMGVCIIFCFHIEFHIDMLPFSTYLR